MQHLVGPNGLLTQADEASTKTDRAGAREKVQLEVAGSYGTDGNLDLEELNDNLQNIPDIKYGEEALRDDNKIKELPADVEVDEYIFEISKEGIVTQKGESSDPTIPPAGDEVTVGKRVEGSNKTYTDESGDTAVIPVGFAIVPNLDDVSEGLVISDKENDTTDEGNQFVWIPVADASSYARNPAYTNGMTLEDDTNYLPDGITSESDNVTKAKGFYISRYEAGDGSTQAKRTSSSGTTGELVSKKDAYVYNWISQTEAKKKAKEFTGESNANVKSGLCTGIQWDMVMAFVNGKNDGGDPSQKFDVTTSSSSRHKGSVQQSGQNEADKVCNIYDLEGNYIEYVAEKNNITDIPCVIRGGSCYNYEASYRSVSDGGVSSNYSFRFVLYIM